MIGKVLRIKFDVFNNTDEIVGLIYDESDYNVTVLQINGSSIRIAKRTIVDIKSVRVSPEVRKMFQDYYKKQQEINKIELEISKLKEMVHSKNSEKETIATSIRNSSGILTIDEFASKLRAAFCLSDSWEIDVTPGCGVAYPARDKNIYFYKDIMVYGKYNAGYSTLVFREYDNALFLVNDYEKLPEFEQFKRKYEHKVLPKVSISSCCYVGDKDTLFFKVEQHVPFEGELTNDLIATIVKKYK